MEVRERRIWGWIGVQRYADNNDFGFAFFRHGRCLVDSDQALFEWETPDGQHEKEYPVELGKGRIVGEIHLDHAKPQVRKTDFDRQSTDWLFMVEKVRGTSPLRPNIAKCLGYAENTSILRSLFQRVPPQRPWRRLAHARQRQERHHEQAKEWASYFRSGDPEYLTDEKWFEAAATSRPNQGGSLTSDAEPENRRE